MTAPRLTMKQALDEILEPRGKTIIDVGCGDGAVVRHLAALGAAATGLEISEGQLKRARAKAGPQESYRVGRGESLPFDTASADAVLYMNSLHHLPLEAMAAALREAARVLKPDGQLIAIEPLAAGTYFEAMRVIEDETGVRAAAYGALRQLPPGLVPEGERTYESIVRMRDADHFIESVVAPDPARRERLPQVEGELRRRFEVYAQYDADGAYFVAPMRRNAFRKIAG